MSRLFRLICDHYWLFVLPSFISTSSLVVRYHLLHCDHFPPTTGTLGFNSPANTSRMSLNSSVQISTTFPTIQLLGLEMLLHYFLGPEVIATAAKNKLILSLGESLSYIQWCKYSFFYCIPCQTFFQIHTKFLLEFCHLSISNQMWCVNTRFYDCSVRF